MPDWFVILLGAIGGGVLAAVAGQFVRHLFEARMHDRARRKRREQRVRARLEEAIDWSYGLYLGTAQGSGMPFVDFQVVYGPLKATIPRIDDAELAKLAGRHYELADAIRSLMDREGDPESTLRSAWEEMQEVDRQIVQRMDELDWPDPDLADYRAPGARIGGAIH